MNDWSYDDAVAERRKQIGAGIDIGMAALIEAGERMEMVARASGVSVEEAAVAAWRSMPERPGAAAEMANWVMDHEVRQRRPVARLRRWWHRRFG